MTFPRTIFTSPAEIFSSLDLFPGRHSKLVRIALYVYVVLIGCPIRYWPLGSNPDETWRFALNYAAAQGLAVGRDVLFTCGPFGYLIFPENIGNNLVQGLLFQTGLWLALAMILADLFFRAGFPLRNLALFSFCFGLATPLFWFNFLGAENLMLSGALILIVIFRLRGSLTRYIAALVLVGLLPLFKLTAGMVGFAALMGFVVERAMVRRWKALPEAALTAVIPAAVTITACLCVMPSASSFLNYLRGSADLISGYSAAMSNSGPHIELLAAMEATAVLVIMLWLQAGVSPGIARFHAVLIAIPLVISFKHGFVRQDFHILNFFCFVALALGLASLTVSLNGKTAHRVVSLMILFFVIWQDNLGRIPKVSVVTPATGVKALRMLRPALRFDRLQESLNASIAAFPEDSRIEPELINLIGDSPVASLSVTFTNLAAAHLSLRLYPVVQRYSAYTPYLDGLNAAWIRDKGPRFLVFDGSSIDERDSWAETPAMWLEVYRWYDSRLLGTRNLLLERRAGPRFAGFETIDRFRIVLPGELRLPVSRDPVFWTLKCRPSMKGRLQQLLFRAPNVYVTVQQAGGVTRTARIIPAVLVSPVLGNYWPGGLSQFAALFKPGEDQGYSVDRILFSAGGGASDSSSCEVEILRLAR